MRNQPFELINLFQPNRIDWNLFWKLREILHDPIVYDVFYRSIEIYIALV